MSRPDSDWYAEMRGVEAVTKRRDQRGPVGEARGALAVLRVLDVAAGCAAAVLRTGAGTDDLAALPAEAPSLGA